MESGLDATLLAVALAGEDKYWLCQPVSGKQLPPEWKVSTCYWLYLMEEGAVQRSLPWYTEELGDVLELNQSTTSKIGRFSVIDDAVSAKKYVVADGDATKTFFLLGSKERDILDAKFDELLEREAAAISLTTPAEAPSEKSKSVKSEKIAELRSANASASPEQEGHLPGGNEEVFSWGQRFIVEYGNRVFYVCSALTGNRTGFKVERLIRNGMTVYLLFEDGGAPPCRVGEGQMGEQVTNYSIVVSDEGKVIVMTTGRCTTAVVSTRSVVEASELEPVAKAPRKDPVKVELPQSPSLKAVGVNLWTDYNDRFEGLGALVSFFPFTAEGGATMHTAVFPSGICVTYDSSTAIKYAGKQKVALPQDDDMVGLLENIQLAKEQYNSI
ncbi:hypothetical protein TRVL_09011 [Trypanosoma vivax]|nr:hypothetical protein TRVL_09011 [Trypanosoma vivax]